MLLLGMACVTDEGGSTVLADTTSGGRVVETGDDTGAPGDDQPEDSARDSTGHPDETADRVDSAEPADTGEPQPASTDFRGAGPWPWTSSEASITTSSGCRLDYTRVTADGGTSGAIVVLAHGLERGREQMTDWAEHYASWGLDVVAPDQCHCSVLDLDQEQNGHDLVELAASLGPARALYVGHSAGGLAAFVATAVDPAAVAFLGLDPTEWDGLAEAHASAVVAPAHAVVGEPGACNLANNFVPILASLPAGRSLRLVDADHCDFERPTDAVCTWPCGTESNDRFSDETIQEGLMGLTTAFLLWRLGIDPSGESWWTAGGEGYALLADLGAIEEP
jgi:pimeloyl-ACP methyl ester carboxylesterase